MLRVVIGWEGLRSFIWMMPKIFFMHKLYGQKIMLQVIISELIMLYLINTSWLELPKKITRMGEPIFLTVEMTVIGLTTLMS